MNASDYFFCGIGGSGMRPLAMFLKAQGHKVSGSDRSFDQGRLAELRKQIEDAGVEIFQQDGSGIRSADQTLVASAAVEAAVPDVAAALKVGAARQTRAEILAQITNEADISVGIAGTSGKSTTTAMIAHILTATGRDPSVINGAPMLNQRAVTGEALGWRCGEGPFVCEVDESDGSIALYSPSVGVVLNISEDHKTLDELNELFAGYAERSARVVVGVSGEHGAALAKKIAAEKLLTFSLRGSSDLYAEDIRQEAGRILAAVCLNDLKVALTLPLIGLFNLENALAAIGVTYLLGVSLAESSLALADFRGTARRLETIGEARGVTVIDDFAHNPEKIGGSLKALTDQFRQVTILYQPHGYGPLRSLRPLYEDAFTQGLRDHDTLMVSKPAYFGGTTTITDDAEKLAATLRDRGGDCQYTEDRENFVDLAAQAEPGSAVVIMGARDDTLTTLARRALEAIESAG